MGSWNRMLEGFEAFRRRYGHGGVPAVYREDRALGRWAAAQRYLARVGRLGVDRRRTLDELGFVWEPREAAWLDRYARLCAFRERFGHAAVPEHYADDPALGRWVQRQRLARKSGRMTPGRAARLERIGFHWAVYNPTARVQPPSSNQRTVIK